MQPQAESRWIVQPEVPCHGVRQGSRPASHCAQLEGSRARPATQAQPRVCLASHLALRLHRDTHTHKHTRATSTSEPESLPPSVQVPPSALIQVRVSVHPSRGRASAHARPPSTRPCPKLHTMRPVSMPGRSRLGAARDPLRKAGGHSVGVMTARLDCSPAPALSPSWACRGGEVHTVTRTVTTSSRTPRPRQGPHQTLWEIFSNVIAQNSSWVHACDIMKTTPSRKAH